MTGTGLTGATAVSFGGTPATAFTVNSATQITATAPAHAAGAVQVTATAPGGTTNGLTYTYVAGAPAPTVTSVNPTTGPTAGGTSVAITGTNFTGATAVSFGGTAATAFTVNSATQITATAPANVAGAAQVQVTTPGGTSSQAVIFTYLSGPVLTSLNPSIGALAGGNTVVLTGNGLTGATAVSFGATPATAFTVTSDTQITATSPAGTGAVSVTATTPSGTSNGVTFTYVAVPTVTSVSPASGPIAGGTSVTIAGTNLAGATAVSFGGTAATTFTVNSGTQITATTPAHAVGAAQVVVSTPGGTSTAAVNFTYVNAPALTSLSPVLGPLAGGNTVILTGTGLTGASAVSFGATPATTFTVNSDTQVTATAPAGSGPVQVTATTPGGTSNGLTYTYTPAPTVTSINPTSGSTAGGTSVTITGTNLTGATAVSFGGTPAATFTVNSATQITAFSPAGALGAVQVVVTTPSGTSTDAVSFTYIAAPTLTNLNPASGALAGGTSVVLTGTGLTGASAVAFGATPATTFTVNSDTQITATAPAGTGAVQVTATAPGGTTNGLTYTYIPAPTVTSINPTSGSTAGGTSVTITGTNLTGATAVTFGGTPGTAVTVVNSTTVTVVTPAHAVGSAQVVVTTPCGVSTQAVFFVYGTTPTVTGVNPPAGPTTGGTAVTITGANLNGALSVTIGGTAATSVIVVNGSTITATTPAHVAGTAPVVVTTAGGPTNNDVLFTYIVAPTITNVAPAQGSTEGGGDVIITGTDLTFTGSVTFDGVAAAFTVNSNTQITAITPVGSPGQVDVVVTTPGGSATAVSAYSYINPPGFGPISPNQGPLAGGQTVTLTGVNYANATSLTFGGLPATIQSNTPTSITAITPAHAAGPVDVVLTTPGGSATGPLRYIYLNPPSATSISPNSGPTSGGNTVSIFGSNLLTAVDVSFSGNSATPTVISDTQLVVTVPAGAGAFTSTVVVTTVGGTASVPGGYTYYDAPSINFLTPSAGSTAGGTVVTISGSSLISTSSVTFDGTPAAFSVINGSTITATAPAHPSGPGSVDVVVSTVGGSATAVSAFTYINPPGGGPTSPNQGTTAGGTTVTLTGVNFANAQSVTFGGQPATINANTPTMINVTTPAHAAGPVDTVISTLGGSFTNANGFIYISPPTITNVSPNSGPTSGGNTVTITGTNLSTAFNVTFDSNSTIPTVISDTQLSVTVPASFGGFIGTSSIRDGRLGSMRAMA